MSGHQTLWMSFVLRAAGIYNLVWGAVIVAFPTAGFDALGLEPPNHPEIVQCLGMVVGVYGIGYWLAARDPLGQWPLVFVGLLGKVLGPIGFVYYAARGTLPWSFGLLNITNDLIWWLPFTAIVVAGRARERQHR